MEELLVSFETAKLAKEKNFNYTNKYGIWVYDLGDSNLVYLNDVTYRTQEFANVECILAPTQSLLQQWLRDEYNIQIQIIEYSKDGSLILEILRNRIMEYRNKTYFDLSEYKVVLEMGLTIGLGLIK